ncbi:MAG: S9 family peptidase [Bacteroidetes bacterium]|nr:S9 family peptidase [Bacteroidota bacterium]
MSPLIFRCSFVWLFALLACPIWGQALQKALGAADYGLWSTLDDVQLSGNGRWASYTLRYDDSADTLFVQATQGKTLRSFAQGTQGQFLGSDGFVCLMPGKDLWLGNLKNGYGQMIPAVESFEVTQQHCVIAESVRAGGHKSLTVYNRLGTIQWEVEQVLGWRYHPGADAIIYQQETPSGIQTFLYRCLAPNGATLLAQIPPERMGLFAWQSTGQQVALLREDGQGLGLYDLLGHRYFDLPLETVTHTTGKRFVSGSFTPLTLSNDGQRVFFGLGNLESPQHENQVEVWNAADVLLYPTKTALAGFEAIDKVGCWEPLTGQVKMTTNNEFSRCMLGADGRYALLWNPYAYQPQQKQFGDTDYYLMDLRSGEKKLLLKQQVGEESQTFFSPTGRYVTYYRDRQWWAYEIKTGQTHALTQQVATVFEDEQYDWAGDVPPYGCAGWTKNDEAILLYDAFDLWLVKPQGLHTRLSRGRGTGTVYRLAALKGTRQSSINFGGRRLPEIDLTQDLWLSARKDGRTTYIRLNSKGSKPFWLHGEHSMSSLSVDQKGMAALYVEQNSLCPPRLVFCGRDAQPVVLFQSNAQHFKYSWSGSKIISYRNRGGESLRGILYYPMGYDPKQSYATIVRIYEKQSWNWYTYVAPTLYNQSGYNKTNFMGQGYFVFEPDISYEKGIPGLSAVDCVSAAVEAILTVPGVDAQRIGLIGNSFGGYQTNMLVAKTNLFAAAVSGAGIADLTSHFLCVNENSARPNNYHLESGQFRMEKSLFDLREAYAANSPINFVEDIKTPLLQWVGKDDPQVSPSQSMELHLALRRLGKANILLAYRDERHALMQRANQIDLTKRVEQWFGHYLKGEGLADWMQPNHD